MNALGCGPLARGARVIAEEFLLNQSCVLALLAIRSVADTEISSWLESEVAGTDIMFAAGLI